MIRYLRNLFKRNNDSAINNSSSDNPEINLKTAPHPCTQNSAFWVPKTKTKDNRSNYFRGDMW